MCSEGFFSFEMNMINTIGVIGGGAWGTALSTVIARAGYSVFLWAREVEVRTSIINKHENVQFLPGVPLSTNINATGDPKMFNNANLIFVAIPAQYLRSILAMFVSHLRTDTTIVICTKGIEIETGALMSEVLYEQNLRNIAVLSGPTFAYEVAKGQPSAVTLACPDRKLGKDIAGIVGGTSFRPYLSEDIIGVQIGGALKNVMAIAAGVALGRGLGENARSAIVTRGFAEMVRLALAKGAKFETLAGLSGLGDLMLTCSSKQSRNFSLGVALGEGKELSKYINDRKSVAEGVTSTTAICRLGKKKKIELPITEALEGVLYKGADIGNTIEGLLRRPFRPEY